MQDTKHRIYWSNIRNGYTARFQSWVPDNVDFALCILHGLGDHSGRYAPSAQVLNRHGVAVLSCDLPGHGENPGVRGHISSVDHLDHHVSVLLENAWQNWPDVPIFLWGHSMGGNIALNYLYRHPDTEIAGVIVTSPWIITSAEPPPVIISVARVLAHIFPKLTLPNNIDPNDISTVPEVVDNYINDSFVHNRISLSTGSMMLAGARFLKDTDQLLPVPCLLMHGTEDKLVLPQGSVDFQSHVPGVKIRLWEGLRHEIHNEHNREEVLGEMAGWMKTSGKGH